MFFNRLGRKSCSVPSNKGADRSDRPVCAHRQRRTAILGIAAAVTVPLTLAQTHLLMAQADAPTVATQQSNLAPVDALKLGSQQFADGKYEEAVATLQQVDATKLDDGQKASLQQVLGQATSAANQRKAARAEFERGEEALAQNHVADAIEAYQSAASNEFADEGTRAKANEQLALAQATSQPSAADSGRVYDQAVKQYNAGDWVAARQGFEAAQAAGYKPGAFKDSPQAYLDRMSKQEVSDAERLSQAAGKARVAALDAVAQAQSAAEAEKAAQAQADAKAQAEKEAQAKAEQETQAQAEVEAKAAAQAKAEADAKVAADAKAKAEADAKAQAEADAKAKQEAVVVAAQAPQAAESVAAAAPTAEQELEATKKLEQIRAQQRAFEAQTLVDQAKAAANDQRYDDALRLYTRATELDPANQDATAGRDRISELVGRSSKNLLNEQERRTLAQRQAIQYQFNIAIEKAHQAIDAQQWTDATKQIQNARIQRAAASNVFAPTDLPAFDSALASAEDALNQARARATAVDQKQQSVEATKDELRRQKDQQAEIRGTVSQLVRSAMQLIQENKYPEALRVIDQILAIDPANDYAIGVRPLVEDRLVLLEQRTYREEVSRQYEKVLNAAQEKMIPYDDILRYPSNWPDISEVRDRTNAEQGQSQVDAQVRAQLDRRLPELRFDQVPLDEVINFLRDVTNANIFVNWNALEKESIDKSTAVSARLRDVKFSKALDVILKYVGGSNVQLGYTVDEGVITISTLEDLSRNVVTRTYDIRDLIINVPDFTNAPSFDLANTTNQGGGGRSGGGGGGGGGGNSLFGNTSTQNQNEQQGATRDELVEQITGLITDTVAPDSWRESGGTIGSLRELQGQLIVTQTPENHRQLANLLEQLREQRAIQVSIEARFLTVQRNFLEDVGMDLDIALNTKSGPNSRWSPINVNQNSYLFTSTIDTTVPGNLSDTFSGNTAAGGGDPNDPDSGSSSGGGGPSPALSIGGSAGNPITYGNSILDDFQVSLLLRATQATQSSTLLTAPRITLFNGQRAYVVVATQRSYVSDLNPTVANGAVAYDPDIDIVSSGVILNVQATVSADRKYVTLTLEPQLARLIRIFEFAFATSEANLGGGDGGTGGGLLQQAVGIVQQPEIEITSVKTTVSIPDQGTLLIGGQTLSGEIEREAGVPVLSKIPFLKRLFTNRSMAKDDQVLLILVKPTIIIQREQEERQFPLLSSQIGH